MKALFSSVVFFSAVSAFATEYAAPAALYCKGTQYDVKAQVVGLQPGELAMEYDETRIVLINKRSATEERETEFANTGAGYSASNRTYVYYSDDELEDRIVLKVKPRRFLTRARAVFRLDNGKVLTYRNCRLFMRMPSKSLF